MPRPYLSLGVEELEALFEQRYHDLGTLLLLKEELGNRQTDRSRALLDRVRIELQRRDPEEMPQAELPGQQPPCAFCNLPAQRVVRKTTHCMALEDGFPVSPGHMLVVPNRHVESFFDTTLEERTELMELLFWCRNFLVAQCNPGGFNIGVNDGKAAGQTVMHVHIHLIPRYEGDRTDPRGGVRWIFPEKANYWSRR